MVTNSGRIIKVDTCYCAKLGARMFHVKSLYVYYIVAVPTQLLGEHALP